MEMPLIQEEFDEAGNEAADKLFDRGTLHVLERMETLLDDPTLRSESAESNTNMVWLKTKVKCTIADLKGETYAENKVD